jgi:thiamine biosynthesis lipoprotein
MSAGIQSHVLLPFTPERLTRRRFLASVGLLAGAGALGALSGRSGASEGASVDVTRPALGTWARVLAHHDDRARAARAVAAAFAAIARVDATMSVHRADTDLARVNRAAGAAEVAVDAALLEVIERARAVVEHSGGVYDPTVLPLMNLYGFYRAAPGYPSEAALGRVMDAVGWRHVVADRARGTLGLARAGAGLDLGSIGKGWALDRAVDALRAAGVARGLVDLGGNVYGLGAPRGAAGWHVGVLHPVTRDVDRTFVLRDAAVATSANHEQFRILGGVRVGHLFDARSGRPADGHLGASVVARTGVASDALSTAAFLLGPSAFAGWPDALHVHFIG